MKNKELFDKTVSILVKAYMDNTLEHTNCYACAVQNIVAGNMGLKIEPKFKTHELWDCASVNMIIKDMKYQETLVADLGFNDEKEATLSDGQIQQMEATGYSYKELSEIEFAFEDVTPFHKTKDQYMYDGLMAVVDYLMIIHEATADEVAEAKALFVKV